jgi:hypothetical protein
MSPSPHQRFEPAARWLKIIVPVIVIAAGITFVVLTPIPVAVHEVKADTP